MQELRGQWQLIIQNQTGPAACAVRPPTTHKPLPEPPHAWAHARRGSAQQLGAWIASGAHAL